MMVCGEINFLMVLRALSLGDKVRSADSGFTVGNYVIEVNEIRNGNRHQHSAEIKNSADHLCDLKPRQFHASLHSIVNV